MKTSTSTLRHTCPYSHTRVHTINKAIVRFSFVLVTQEDLATRIFKMKMLVNDPDRTERQEDRILSFYPPERPRRRTSWTTQDREHTFGTWRALRGQFWRADVWWQYSCIPFSRGENLYSCTNDWVHLSKLVNKFKLSVITEFYWRFRNCHRVFQPRI